jgi:hypothetical protein
METSTTTDWGKDSRSSDALIGAWKQPVVRRERDDDEKKDRVANKQIDA